MERAKPAGGLKLGWLETKPIGGARRCLASGGARERDKPDQVRIVNVFLDGQVH
jgi:hypothetical protein